MNALSPTPATPQLPDMYDYPKKILGKCVIENLKAWLTQVTRVLEEAVEECDKYTALIYS